MGEDPPIPPVQEQHLRSLTAQAAPPSPSHEASAMRMPAPRQLTGPALSPLQSTRCAASYRRTQAEHTTRAQGSNETVTPSHTEFLDVTLPDSALAIARPNACISLTGVLYPLDSRGN